MKKQNLNTPHGSVNPDTGSTLRETMQEHAALDEQNAAAHEKCLANLDASKPYCAGGTGKE